MTFTQFGDEFSDAAADLTDAEFRTHVEALIWSSRRLLDLHIPKRHVRRFAESADAAAAVDGLVVKGWWEDRGDAWWIGVHFAEWQEERSDVERRREGAALRSRRWRKHRLGDHSLCLPRRCPQAVTRDETSDETSDSTRGNTPSQPNPTQPWVGLGKPNPTLPSGPNGTRDPLGGDAVASLAESLPRCEHGMPGGKLPNPLREDKGRKCPQCRQDAIWASSKPAPKGGDR